MTVHSLLYLCIHHVQLQTQVTILELTLLLFSDVQRTFLKWRQKQGSRWVNAKHWSVRRKQWQAN